METHATPRPWRIDERSDVEGITIRTYGTGYRDLVGEQTSDGRLIAYLHYGPLIIETARANAALIVRAVNAHDALVRMCGELLEVIRHSNDWSLIGIFPEAEAAVAEAKGGTT